MTAPGDELSRAVAALAPAGVLRLLAQVVTGEADEPPMVTLHLSGGHVLDGALVRVGAERGDESVVLTDQQTGRLTYVLLDNVIAVDVRNPRPFQDVLTGGRLPQPQAGEPVSSLALQRAFAPTVDFPVRIDWDALDRSAPLMGNLERVLTGLRQAIEQVRIDEFGRQTWAQVRLVRVEHRAATALSVQRAGDELLVAADLLAALPRTVTDVLYREISSLL
jgi:hypothetical protein